MTLGTKPSRLVGVARRPRRSRRRVPHRRAVHDPGPAGLPQRLRASGWAITRRSACPSPRPDLLQAPLAQHGLAGVSPRCSAGSGLAQSAPFADRDACDGRSRSPFRSSITTFCRARRSSSAGICCRSSPSSACSPLSAPSRASACSAASTSRVRRARPSSPRITAAALLPPAWQSLNFIRAISRTSTVEQAHSWILSDIPAGSTIVIETQALLLSAQTYKAKNVPQLVLDCSGARRLRRLRQSRRRLHRRVVTEIRRRDEPAERLSGFVSTPIRGCSRTEPGSDAVHARAPSIQGRRLRVFRLR